MIKYIIFIVIYIFNIACTQKFKGKDYFKAIDDCQDKDNPFIMNHTCLDGTEFPFFNLTDIEGKLINNKRLKGKYILLNFWFIECPPCITEIPGLNYIDSYDSSQMEVISICNNSKLDIASFLGAHPIKYTIIPDGKVFKENYLKIRFGYPTNILYQSQFDLSSSNIMIMFNV